MVLNRDNAQLLEELYQRYCNGNGQGLTPEWQRYFQSLDRSNGHPAAADKSLGHPAALLPDAGATLSHLDSKVVGVQSLIESYRRFGNLAAKIDPLEMRRENRELLSLSLYGLDAADLDRVFPTHIANFRKAKLRDIIAWMEKTYCSSIGVEYAYVRNTQERNWLEERMESTANSETLPLDLKLHLYEKLIQAESFERFLAQKYVGKKRFSIEGCETFIPLLDTVIQEGASLGVKCIVLGMAHRGRLNVLANIMQKQAGLIFAEFDEIYNTKTIDYADVKYHLGYSHDYVTRSKQEVHLSLAFNPSHLEAVNPVVLGSIRARQKKAICSQPGPNAREKVRKTFMPVIVHGDAAFMGQGIVSESLNLCNLRGYEVGGTLHIIINNQIGFTTPPPDSRSTEYATDLAKGFQVPIFHVNTDDPEAAYRVTKLALEYRQRFAKDVIVDLIGYRRLGHNETDEPAFTQPLMYEYIKKHPTSLQIHRKRLLEAKEIRSQDLDSIEQSYHTDLESTFNKARAKKFRMQVDTMQGAWSSFSRHAEKVSSKQAASKIFAAGFRKKLQNLVKTPPSFHLHPKLKRLLENREQMLQAKLPVDWGFAETLAFASILAHGHNIRFSGQDVKRGTFSHRHAVLTDYKTGAEYIPLNHFSDTQGDLEIWNSPLSEFAVLGFEYGFSLADPHTLVLWEAQFGDFANGAQIIFDQFISSSEIKWYRMSGLVILLPHAYEGQGPEHSSARLERLLQLCANQNMQVCNCSTPAQYFHLLRRQILRDFRKPLIILTPKSLLRHPAVSSTMAEMDESVFCEFLCDTNKSSWAQGERLLLCSGKIYYELEAHRAKEGRKDILIGRLEQIYPFPVEQIQAFIQACKNLKRIFWVQEEPVNQGAWSFVREPLLQLLSAKQSLNCIARPESASPAAGLLKIHQMEQEAIIKKAIG